MRFTSFGGRTDTGIDDCRHASPREDLPFWDRDLLFEHSAVASAFGFDDPNDLRDACVYAGRRALGLEDVPSD